MENDLEIDQELTSLPVDDLITLPADSVRVVDPDEEVFLLYTRLASKAAPDGKGHFAGLGFVDSKQDVLTVRFEIPAYPRHSNKSAAKPSHSKGRRTKKGSSGTMTVPDDREFVEYSLAQDKTALRSRQGDTGSVLWRISLELGQILLNQLHSSRNTLFNPTTLVNCSVLELGAGTGLLGMVLSCWTRHYVITDLDSLTRLIRKNITVNEGVRHPGVPTAALGRLVVEPLDWLQLLQTPPRSRASIYSSITSSDEPVDLIMLTDCIYNPSLLPALVETIDYFSKPGYTRVFVAVELRSDDVMREFLELWMKKSDWEIWRVGGDSETGWLDVCYTAWVGWKRMPKAE